MNRNNLISLIVLDVVVVVMALGFIAFRYNSLTSAPRPLPMMTRAALPAPAASVKEQPAKRTVEPPAPKNDVVQTSLPSKATRNIGFLYRNSKAGKVEIIGDFNQWVPKPMTKAADSRWTISVAIAPGEYAYNFVVDGRPVRDPNNPKKCDVGRGFQNSFLSVKPLTNEKSK